MDVKNKYKIKIQRVEFLIHEVEATNEEEVFEIVSELLTQHGDDLKNKIELDYVDYDINIEQVEEEK